MKVQRLSFQPIVLIALLLGCWPVSCSPAVAWQDEEKPKLNFDEHVKPILTQRCSSCHGSSRKEADLDVTNYTALMMGGGSGEVIEPGSAGESYLYQLVTHEESPEMPPSGKIPDAEIKLIGQWIEMGALENAGSKPRKMKPKIDLSLSSDANVRPDEVAYPLMLPLEPVLTTSRPSTTALAASPWAPLVAVAAPKQVLLYDTQSTELVGVLPFEEGIAHRLTFSRTGNLLLGAGGKDGSLGVAVIWDVSTGERLATMGEESDVVLAADIRNNHDLVAIGGPSKIVKVLSVADGSTRFEITKHTEWITAIEFSPDGKYLATGDRNGGLHVWETATGAELFMLSGHSQSITSISWRTDSNVLASASEDSTIRVWEINKGSTIKNWNAHPGGVTDVQFLRDGNLASCGRDHTAKTWKQDGSLLREFPKMSDVAVSIAFCNESSRMVAADWTGDIAIWNALEGEQLASLAANPPSLEDRISQAHQRLEDLRIRRKPVEEQMARTRESIESMTRMMAENQAQRTQAASQIQDLKSQQENTQQEIATFKEEQKNLKNEHQQLTTSQPLIQTALESITQASLAMPNDAELKQALDNLTSKQTNISNRLADLNGLMEGVSSEIDSRHQNLGQLESMVQNFQAQLTEIDSRLAELQPQLPPLEQTLQQQTSEWEQLSNEMLDAEQERDRWQRHVGFIEELSQLNRQLEEVQQALLEKEVAEEEALNRLKVAENDYLSAKQKKEATMSETEQIRVRILELKRQETKPKGN